MKMDVHELTWRLINMPSISGDEKAVAEFLAEYLSSAGFEVQLQDAAENRPNVYARHGEPDVVLSTHTDTVPPYIEFSEDTEFIYGRGACDAKGIIAAMVNAAEGLVEVGQSDFGLLFLVGEEAGSVGARVANSIPNRVSYLINGEPTESKLAVGSKGALRLAIRAEGRAAHSAYPEMGESAVEKLLTILSDVRGIRLPEDPTLGASTMNIGVISGGVAANVVPQKAEAELMFRVVTDTESMKQLIEDAVANRAVIEYTFACNPVFTERLDEMNTTVVSFTTDIPALTNWGKPLLFGPGSIRDAHSANEKISKRDLLEAVHTYSVMVLQLKARLADISVGK